MAAIRIERDCIDGFIMLHMEHGDAQEQFSQLVVVFEWRAPVRSLDQQQSSPLILLRMLDVDQPGLCRQLPAKRDVSLMFGFLPALFRDNPLSSCLLPLLVGDPRFVDRATRG